MEEGNFGIQNEEYEMCGKLRRLAAEVGNFLVDDEGILRRMKVEDKFVAESDGNHRRKTVEVDNWNVVDVGSCWNFHRHHGGDGGCHHRGIP